MKDLYDIIDELRAQWVFAQQSNINSGAGTGANKDVPLYVDFGDIRLKVVGVKNVRGKIVLETSDE